MREVQKPTVGQIRAEFHIDPKVSETWDRIWYRIPQSVAYMSEMWCEIVGLEPHDDAVRRMQSELAEGVIPVFEESDCGWVKW